jgi:hypothetical protein
VCAHYDRNGIVSRPPEGGARTFVAVHTCQTPGPGLVALFDPLLPFTDLPLDSPPGQL